MDVGEWTGCGRKKRMKLKKAIKLMSMTAKSPTPLKYYKCRFCGGWHMAKLNKVENG